MEDLRRYTELIRCSDIARLYSEQFVISLHYLVCERDGARVWIARSPLFQFPFASILFTSNQLKRDALIDMRSGIQAAIEYSRASSSTHLSVLF